MCDIHSMAPREYTHILSLYSCNKGIARLYFQYGINMISLLLSCDNKPLCYIMLCYKDS